MPWGALTVCSMQFEALEYRSELDDHSARTHRRGRVLEFRDRSR